MRIKRTSTGRLRFSPPKAGGTLALVFSVTNAEDNDRPLPGASVTIQHAMTGTIYCHQVTDERGEVRFRVFHEEDIPVIVKIRHPLASIPYESTSVITPTGLKVHRMYPPEGIRQ